jgi:hypothetical protein
MRQAIQKLLMPILIPVLVATTVSAQQDDSELELVPLPTELRLSGMAKVVTHIARPSDCLAAVAINRIDGEMKALSARDFLIEPGVHTINGKATLDLTHCPLNDNKLIIPGAADLEVDFELGNTYFIGYYHPSANPGEWQLVVWDIETNPQGSVDQ